MYITSAWQSVAYLYSLNIFIPSGIRCHCDILIWLTIKRIHVFLYFVQSIYLMHVLIYTELNNRQNIIYNSSVYHISPEYSLYYSLQPKQLKQMDLMAVAVNLQKNKGHIIVFSLVTQFLLKGCLSVFGIRCIRKCVNCRNELSDFWVG